MLQQTVVAAVVPHFERWMKTFPDVRALAEAPPESVLKAWAGLGYYARARNLHKGAQALVQRGAWPGDAEAWQEIPGVGAYTAGALTSLAFNQRAPLLDGNVARVFSRVFGLGFLPGDGAAHKRIYWDLARMWVDAPTTSEKESSPVVRPGALNEALMELGATICIPKSPRCGECPLATHCQARRHAWTDSLPPLKVRARIEAVSATAAMVRYRGALLVETRKPGAFLAGHVMAPLYLGDDAAHWRTSFAQEIPGWDIVSATQAGSVRHTIMAKRYDVAVWDLVVRPTTSSSSPVRTVPTGQVNKGVSPLKRGTGKLAKEPSNATAWLPLDVIEDSWSNAFARKLWAASSKGKPS